MKNILGLDASTALHVMECLKRLSNEGRKFSDCRSNVKTRRLTLILIHTGTIIFSIHQPSYAIFKLFDRLMLMCKGECVFHGPAQNALSFFSSQGYQCEEHDNPTDFALNILFKANQRSEILTVLTSAYIHSSWCQEIIALNRKKTIGKANEIRSHAITTYEAKAPQPLWTEFFYVSQRTLIKFVRNWGLILSQVLVSIILGLLIGLVFYDIKATVNPGIQNRFNVINFILVGQIFSTLATLESLIQERSLFIHVSKK